MTVRRLAALSVAVGLLASACGSSAATSSVAGITSGPSPVAGPVATSAAPPAEAPATPTATPPASAAPTIAGALDSADWPVYHLDAARSGKSLAFPAVKTPLQVAWSKKLDGAVYAEPLVVHSKLVVATEGDSVYSLDPASGSVAWASKLGTPVPLDTLPCGDIDPLGITGTPAYDPQSDSIFAVAEVTGPHHILFALDPANGKVRWSRTVDLPGDDPRTHQQRPALAVANGYVYVAFGGLAGDCGQYTGKVVGVPTSGSGATIAYRVPVKREGAIWATGGPVIDSTGNLYVSTGNGSSTSSYDGSDSVVELTPDLKQISLFAPSIWAADNAGDADLGSLSPALLPNGFVFIAGKNGRGYVMRQGSLGGIGGQVSVKGLCAAFGGTSVDGNDVFVPCTDGVTRVTVASNGSFTAVWKTATGSNGPPVIGGGAVWTVRTGTGVLSALDEKSGKTIGSVSLGAVPHFVSPTLWQGLVFVGTTSGVAAVSG
jgi:outer membrane protein assembly factor BamB